MTCGNCGNEQFQVLKCYRNKQRVNGAWKFNQLCDTRIVICNDCGERFLTESFIIAKITYQNFKRLEQRPGQQEFNF